MLYCSMALFCTAINQELFASVLSAEKQSAVGNIVYDKFGISVDEIVGG